MIPLLTLTKACNDLLRSAYPNMKIYGSDSVEALERPCFYTEIVPYTRTNHTVNLCLRSCGFKVTYLEAVPNEEEEIKLYDTLERLFSLKLKVEDRYLTITDIDQDYAGSEHNILQVTITFEWYDSIAKEDEHELMSGGSITTYVNGTLTYTEKEGL